MLILAAHKPSELGKAVIETAIEEARLRGADLVVVQHAEQEWSSPMEPGVPDAHGTGTGKDRAGRDIEKVRADLDALRLDAEVKGVACDTVLVTDGDDAASSVLEVARTSNVELIVVGVRRRSRVGKALLGSESQRILLEADCPVLAVKES